jgi:hypothetical protein
MLERGALSVLLGYQRALPLLGLGCVLALARPLPAVLGAALCIVGLWLGFAAREWLIAALVTGTATAPRLGLAAPVSCLAAGLLLALTEPLRSWLLPGSAVVIGAMFGFGVKLIDPSFHDPNFLRGAVAAAIWLVGAAALSAQLLQRSWFRVASRIAGSWLIAIGLMLGTSILLPRHGIGELPQPPQTLGPPGSPDGSGAPDSGRPEFPFAPSGFNPLRQP